VVRAQVGKTKVTQARLREAYKDLTNDGFITGKRHGHRAVVARHLHTIRRHFLARAGERKAVVLAIHAFDFDQTLRLQLMKESFHQLTRNPEAVGEPAQRGGSRLQQVLEEEVRDELFRNSELS